MDFAAIFGRTEDENLISMPHFVAHELGDGESFEMPRIQPRIDAVIAQSSCETLHVVPKSFVFPGVGDKYPDSRSLFGRYFPRHRCLHLGEKALLWNPERILLLRLVLLQVQLDALRTVPDSATCDLSARRTATAACKRLRTV